MAVHGRTATSYAGQLAGRVSSLVARCSRATRRLLRRNRLRTAYGSSRRSSTATTAASVAPRPAAAMDTGGKKGNFVDVDDGEGIWRRAILMGGRCQPLDFAGAIHYDSFGRRLDRPPTTPRSASSLSCRSSDSLATYLDTPQL
ncbi:uncharacterized protein LOC104583082 [Brachypodium distachyon]|uniref:Uncharacterized protein n=1 Tax=Brachypodium distachyon TaxID=15368 RepID=I1HFV6_BRADI|nr:uncharacterized protein LOC104583082 [Brachypodium distachyon]KQK04611.1 hypothetical protein BRADI_2g14630v3 [Brachypodium distachyon]|eukprot:XP_010233099.1 uncharacterized protein LOC104583082 [Brachypodium distachyon]